MIDCGDFQFACPPLTGGGWFVDNLKRVGVSYKLTDGLFSLFQPFPYTNNGSNSLKVSLVRHPCDWLSHNYQDIKNSGYIGMKTPFLELLSVNTLEDFVRDYLMFCPGEMAKLFLSYEADTFMRIEDMPWAMVEFLEMIGIERPHNLSKTTTVQLGPPIMDKNLRRQILTAERRLADAFDYY